MAVSFESDCPLDLPRFQSFLDKLPLDVYRAKGILWFWGSQLRHVFQLSGKRCDMKGVHAMSLKENRLQQPDCNQLVLIGRNLNALEIKQQLTDCIAI